MLMAKLFQELKRHNKFHFDLVFLVMDPGYNEMNRQIIENNAKLLDIPITVFESDIFDAVYEIEKSFEGIVIFANHEKCYDPENDHKYIDAEDFISQELCTLPEEFFVAMDIAPTMLEQYMIK